MRELASRKPSLDAAVIDVTQAIDLDEIRDFHIIHPLLPLLALGLREHEADVVAAATGFRSLGSHTSRGKRRSACRTGPFQQGNCS
ncbi:hypothetical protein HU675_0049560 (plasmid) [Bradyrhizobium septentrionale]|uniref:Uncharacterized protein n=1 Tax=Bradyrhizobium septentrionale TaxID=1404411 RepID=A0A973WB00_9BRAD|nr:hypothetical protein [Bradyrhizobium septentrionale]UGY30361.1 hypothetical protein HU675_0049560 [Bradyrhizobium septentrionale]